MNDQMKELSLERCNENLSGFREYFAGNCAWWLPEIF
jgi:hypothetical protein